MENVMNTIILKVNITSNSNICRKPMSYLTLNYFTNVKNESHIVRKQQMNAHYSMKHEF
jgi:hypothetical protein